MKFYTAFNPWKYSTKQQSIVILCNPIFIIYCSFLFQLKSNSSMCSVVCAMHTENCVNCYHFKWFIRFRFIFSQYRIQFNYSIDFHCVILWYVCVCAQMCDCATVCLSVDLKLLNELSGIISNHWKSCTLKLSAIHGVNVVLAYDNSSICFVDPKPAFWSSIHKWNEYTHSSN